MKKSLLIIFYLTTISLSAQSVVQGTIGASGSTLSSNSGDLVMNFTIGQPFGTGEMSDSELTIIQGLQGANVNIVEVSEAQGVGIDNFSSLEAELIFNPNSGEIILQGNNVSNLSGQIVLSDVNGRVISRGSIHEGEIDRVQLDEGNRKLLILTVLTNENKRLSKKLIF